jgi:hypothetical protein
MQIAIFNGLQDIVVALIGVFFAFMVAYIKQHFSVIQIRTASGIATEAVNFAVQAAKKLGITEDLEKYNSALTKAKELASKAGLNFTDSQWETFLESAYKKAKAELQPLASDDIATMVTTEVANVSGDMITSLIKQELSKLNVTPVQQPQTAPTTEVEN